MASDRVTLKEVARDTGLSIITVSRVLNEAGCKYPISAETRGRVLASTKRLGYRPNVIARALRAKRTDMVCLLYRRQRPSHFSNDDFYLGVQGGIEEVLAERGKNLLICSVEPCDLESGKLPEVVQQGLTDACLLFEISSPAFFASLSQRGIPVVAINTTRVPATIDQVIHDDSNAVRIILDRLVAWGHRHFALLTALQPADAIVVREGSVQQTIATLGLSAPRVVRADPWSQESGKWAVELKKSHPEITAVVGASDGLADAAARQLIRAGFGVPQDVSVASCAGNLHWLPHELPLMTVRFDQEEMGQRAAQMVLRRLNAADAPPSRQVLAGELIEGATAGPSPTRESGNQPT